MRIGIIGIGHVGMAFAQYIKLYEADRQITLSGCYTRGKKKRRQLNDVGIHSYESIEALVRASDIIMITTPDDVIEPVIFQILNGLRDHLSVKGKVFIHCSGAKSSEVFAPLIDIGASGYSLHPIRAFAGGPKDVTSLDHCYVTLEGHPENNQEPIRFLNLFEGRILSVKTANKPLYHAAAVMVSNYSVTLIHEGLSYLIQAGFSETDAYSMLKPLLTGTIDNAFRTGVVDSLTGPIVRGDHGVINEHLKVINRSMGQEAEALYRILGLRTLNMIKNSRIDEVTYNNLLKEFKKEGM